jgi:hypothetical protein
MPPYTHSTLENISREAESNSLDTIAYGLLYERA